VRRRYARTRPPAARSLCHRQPRPVRLEGKAGLLPPDVATPFGLVLHDWRPTRPSMGALSNSAGQVTAKWRSNGRNNQRFLAFAWKETGGRRCASPARWGSAALLLIPRHPARRSNATSCRAVLGAQWKPLSRGKPYLATDRGTPTMAVNLQSQKHFAGAHRLARHLVGVVEGAFANALKRNEGDLGGDTEFG
jgi:hypothetical protein